MRQIVLDTETTGLELELGHRIIEIGCVELVNRRATGRHFLKILVTPMVPLAIGYMLAGWPHQALLPPLSIGFVSLIGVAVMAPVSSLTASYGARLAHATPKRRLEIAFGLFLLLVAARFIVSLI